ncbi:probable maleylacetoacetate isomerase 2 isoform X1 [Penaeus chinensis]|uniref:probable maleylacetoacetate isomerase 2 isoform X1 n=1 Tax=Penaeus chinensis TaxID=139456 RepID=UPI001FB76A89|nr:probable maleylacetoacetate isomerase 2 isoform X1 [Penaeus chinensis]
MSSSKPILYSYFRSSCSWRVRIALAHKGVDYEYRAINLLKQEQVSDEYKKLNPLGQVPALIVNENTLTQSISILEYLEEAYPQKPLLPKDLFKRAKVREVCEIIGSGIQPLQNLSVLQKIGETKMEWGHFYIQKGFVALEQVLAESAGKYCVGDEVTIADCCLIPQVYNANRFKVDMAAFPVISRVHDALMSLDAFKAAHPSQQPDCPEDLK